MRVRHDSERGAAVYSCDDVVMQCDASSRSFPVVSFRSVLLVLLFVSVTGLTGNPLHNLYVVSEYYQKHYYLHKTRTVVVTRCFCSPVYLTSDYHVSRLAGGVKKA